MDNKIKELTDKLYQEGLSKGRREGEAILTKAGAEAEAIVAKAREEAAGIVAEAAKQAEDYRHKVESDLRMASREALQTTRKSIEDLLTSSTIGKGVKEAASDPAFLRQLLMAVAGRFSSENQEDLSIILPENLREEMEDYVRGELSSTLSREVEVSFSDKFHGGFTIGPKDGSWYISLKDSTLEELIGEYVRPMARKLLFG